MKYFAYGEVVLKTQDWIAEYLRNVNAFIEKHHGKVLSRSINLERIEGERPLPTNVVLIEFASREDALRFFDDPDYQPLRTLRLEGTSSQFTLFPAEDLALTMLPR